METPTLRKTFKYKLLPTPGQEQRMAFVVHRCRELYNAGSKNGATPGRNVA
jgi:hypothetical protein